MLGGENGIRAREGAGAGINLVPAVTSPFMWSVNSKRVEDGVTMSGDEAELDGVLAGEHVEEGKGEFWMIIMLCMIIIIIGPCCQDTDMFQPQRMTTIDHLCCFRTIVKSS